jgi:23S rRNA (uracil1939-C5)-methyltransferase
MIELDIERAVPGGDMLARHDGRVVFVAGALPGERVRAVITRTRGKVAWAQVRDVLTPSPDRRDVHTDPLCGGRTYAHIRYERQLSLKADVIADAFRRIGKQPLEAPVHVEPSPETGYRLRARLHVNGVQMGFYREGSHVICSAAMTEQLTAHTLAAAEWLQATMGASLQICESVLVSETANGDARVLVCAARAGASLKPFVGLTLPDGVTGLVVQSSKGEFVAAGGDQLTDASATLPGVARDGRPSVSWSRRGASFFQGNRFLVGALLDRVLAAAEGRFVDLYAGVGLFAVSLAARGQSGLAIEGDPTSASDLALNAAPYEARLGTRVASVEVAVARPPATQPDVVVVDPPRTGISTEALAGLIAWQAPRIVYVSCDVPTLARDTQRLVAGGYRLSSIEALDMFPNTPHVECVAIFDRVIR